MSYAKLTRGARSLNAIYLTCKFKIRPILGVSHAHILQIIAGYTSMFSRIDPVHNRAYKSRKRLQ